MSVRLFLPLMVTSLIFFSTASLALAANNSLTNLDTETITGSVVGINQNILTVETDEGQRDVIVPTDAQINKNGVGANLENLKPGDHITIVRQIGGQVLSISSASAQLINWQAWALAIGALILAIGLSYILNRRKNSPNYALGSSGFSTAHQIRPTKK